VLATIKNNLDLVTILTTLLAFSVCLRVILQFQGQRWASTLPQTMTFVLLPVITFAITSVIADNIALSLGMVGALSIVRFRNPVRSPFELSLYFLMIALGVSASVSLKICIVLGVVSLSLIMAAGLLEKVARNWLNINLFSASFAEANDLNVLEVVSLERLPQMIADKDLISYSNRGGNCIYRLGSPDKKKLIELGDRLSTTDNVKSVEFIAG